MHSYAIGDIHGCKRSLLGLLEMLNLQGGDRLIFLGDYIDRGPDSKGVIDTIVDLQNQDLEVVCLRGNHEQLFLDARSDPATQEVWMRNGGKETLDSFGVKYLHEIPQRYFDFCNDTLFYYETGNFLCVHGGPDFNLTDPLAHPERLLWARYWYDNIDYQWLGNRIILHGHTPEDITAIREQHKELATRQYLNLDNGCVYANRPRGRDNNLGRLLAFGLEDGDLMVQENIE